MPLPPLRNLLGLLRRDTPPGRPARIGREQANRDAVDSRWHAEGAQMQEDDEARRATSVAPPARSAAR